jgi:DNA invertase Pin-like site-specific DNA recombinase
MDTNTATSTVYGYCRVSTEGQEDGAGLEAQAVSIRAEADRRGWSTLELHQEVVSGGKSVARRPVLASILERIGRGDVLVVAKGDRLARSLVVLAQLLEASDRDGWSLVLIDLGVDTSTPAGRLSAQVVGAAAEYERQMIRARTRDGLAVKRSQGVRLGRPVKLSAEALEMVVNLRASGLSLRGIAEHLTALGIATASGKAVWSTSNVQTALNTATQEQAHRSRVAALAAA